MTLFPGVALVVGSASGIGQQSALSFVEEGCMRIALLDRNAAGLAETAKLIAALSLPKKAEVFTQVIDVLEEESIAYTIGAIVKLWGRIDYAVNSAGITGNNRISSETLTSQFDNINGINYRGAWLCSREELRVMLNQEPYPSHDGRPGNRGSVVNVASQLGFVGRPRATAYCGSKSAIIGLTKVDAIDYSQHNIRVNCVCPGIVEYDSTWAIQEEIIDMLSSTPMTQGPDQAERLKPVISIAPMNRMGTPQEIADAVIFLSSSKATFMQGAAMVVDGGYTIN